MFVIITQVRKGDTIIEGKDKIPVKKIEHDRCSSFGTHVNDRLCYDKTTIVQVESRSSKQAESKHFEESGLGDFEDDYRNLQHQALAELLLESITGGI